MLGLMIVFLAAFGNAPDNSWELQGSYLDQDLQATVMLPLAAYPTEDECKKVANETGNRTAAFQLHGMTLQCVFVPVIREKDSETGREIILGK